MTLPTAEPRSKRWTREEFYELAEQGYFRGKRVQLVEGEIIEMAPQGHPHSMAISYLTRWATMHFPEPMIVRVQMPFNASARSDPEPDVAIVHGPAEAYEDHPERAELIIEVADSSVLLDRRKIRVYAAAGVPEYWLVNLPERQVEVHRGAQPLEKRFRDVSTVKPGDSLAPLARPNAAVDLAKVFASV